MDVRAVEVAAGSELRREVRGGTPVTWEEGEDVAFAVGGLPEATIAWSRLESIAAVLVRSIDRLETSRWSS